MRPRNSSASAIRAAWMISPTFRRQSSSRIAKRQQALPEARLRFRIPELVPRARESVRKLQIARASSGPIRSVDSTTMRRASLWNSPSIGFRLRSLESSQFTRPAAATFRAIRRTGMTSAYLSRTGHRCTATATRRSRSPTTSGTGSAWFLVRSPVHEYLVAERGGGRWTVAGGGHV
jgi:hypothetical protein